MAQSRGVPPRPQGSAAQADASAFAALLDAATPQQPDRGITAPPASAKSNQPKPAADSGAATHDDAAAAAPTGSPSSGSAPSGSAAPDNSAPADYANAAYVRTDAAQGAPAKIVAGDGVPVAAPDAKDAATSDLALNVKVPSAQNANTEGMHACTAKGAGDRMPSPAPNTNGNATLVALTLRGGNDQLDAAASATRNPAAPSPNGAAVSDPTRSSGGDASSNAAGVPVVAAVLNVSDPASTNAPPVVGKPEPDSKGGEDDKSSNDAAALPVAGQAQLAAADIAQPIAAAFVVNPAPDPAPAAFVKPGLAIADAVKSRARLMPAADDQAAAQAGSTDQTNATATDDSDTSNSSPSGLNGATDDSSTAAFNAQQPADQPQTLGANSAALLTQIDFASLGGGEHVGSRAEATLGQAMGSAAPSAGANAAAAPNFGIFAPNAIAADVAAPAAAAPEPAVPVAGLAVAIAARAHAGSSQFDIRLDPPELGRIDVRLDVDGSGQVRTHVTADRADTLQLLQSQQPQLERALEQAGLKTADNGLQFTLRDQSFAGQNGGPGGQPFAHHAAAPLVIPEIDTGPIDTAQIYARLRLGNGLDISV